LERISINCSNQRRENFSACESRIITGLRITSKTNQDAPILRVAVGFAIRGMRPEHLPETISKRQNEPEPCVQQSGFFYFYRNQLPQASNNATKASTG
jgi:hypothetical protein